MFDGFQGLVCAMFGVALIGSLIGALCLRAAWSLYSRVATYHLRKPTMGNCLGIALAHLVISVAIFFLLESMIGAFQTGNLWLEIALGVAVLIASYLTLIQVARVILMTDFHRAAIFAACQFSLMLPLSLLLGATWWMVR